MRLWFPFSNFSSRSLRCRKVFKTQHTATADNHKSVATMGVKNHVESCCDNLRFFEVLGADVT